MAPVALLPRQQRRSGPWPSPTSSKRRGFLTKPTKHEQTRSRAVPAPPVPTDDNPADWPTREDKFHLITPEAVEVPMRIPPSALFGPLDRGDKTVLATCKTWRAALSRGRPEAAQP